MQGQSVVLGGLPLMVNGADYQSVDGYNLTVTGEETSLGAAQSVTSVLLSMLTNGSVVSYDRDDNRSPVFIVEVSAAHDDGVALAKGEAALRAVCKQRVELLWTPPQTGAPTAVFDIVHSTLTPLYSDMDEVNQIRAYRIDMQALPYARSLEESLFPAVETGSPALVTVNNADTLTGWSTWIPDTEYATADPLTDVGSAVRYTNGYTGGGPESGFSMRSIHGQLTFAPGTLATRHWLVVEYRTSNPPTEVFFTGRLRNSSIPGSGGDISAYKVADIALDTDWRQAWFYAPRDQGTVDLFQFYVGMPSPYVGMWLEIRDVSATAAPPALGTRKQLVQSLIVGGTETTQGSVNVSSPDGIEDLREVIVYTRPDDGGLYKPPMSTWITNSLSYRTPDAGAVSGAHWEMVSAGGVLTWKIPAAAVPPGDYHVVVRMQRTNSSQPIPLKLSAASEMNTVQYGLEERFVSPQGNQNAWVIRSLGTLTLPGARVGDSGLVNLWLERTNVAEPVGSILFDEMWLFKADGALTIVSGLLHPMLQIVAPSLEEPTGAIWATDDDTLEASVLVSALASSRQHHELDPGANMVFTVTTEQTDAVVSARAFKRWNSYPAE